MMIPANDVPAGQPAECLAEHVVFKNEFFTVYNDDVRFGDGRTGTYVRVTATGELPGVVILPLSEGYAGLVRVYRYPVASWEWGLPRGFGHTSNPVESARAELIEELGEAPGWLRFLGQQTPDSGVLASVVYLFAAEYSHQARAPRDPGEVDGIRWVPVPALLAGIGAGEITDGFTLSAVSLALCQGVLPAAALSPAALCTRCG